MKKNQVQSNYWYIILSVLLLILIILVSTLLYVVLKVPKHKTEVNKEVIYIKDTEKSEDIKVYPKELPEYNNDDYQQIGLLTANESDKEPIILPLFAKKLRNNRDRWQYYTATDKNNMMRLPLHHQNMNCDDSIGCKEIYDGDTINVEIYKNRVFTATIYKNQTPQYFADVY